MCIYELGFLYVELQTVVSGPVEMLGTKLSSPAKAAHAVTPERLSSPEL